MEAGQNQSQMHEGLQQSVKRSANVLAAFCRQLDSAHANLL
jgi:hypothetical protein